MLTSCRLLWWRRSNQMKLQSRYNPRRFPTQSFNYFIRAQTLVRIMLTAQDWSLNILPHLLACLTVQLIFSACTLNLESSSYAIHKRVKGRKEQWTGRLYPSVISKRCLCRVTNHVATLTYFYVHISSSSQLKLLPSTTHNHSSHRSEQKLWALWLHLW